MKTILNTKFILTFLLLLSTFAVRAQWINAITHVPANPTSTDTIYFYADIDFPSGSCDQHTDMIVYSLPYISATSLHCLGMLTFICNHVDTFKINPLPGGNYTFLFHVDAGALPSPCTPGIIQGPTDSIVFTVSSASSITNNEIKNNDFSIFPNPASDKINLEMNNEMAISKNKELVIYSVEGKEIGNWKLKAGKLNEEIDISALPNGIYFCSLNTENKIIINKKMTVLKIN